MGVGFPEGWVWRFFLILLHERLQYSPAAVFGSRQKDYP